MPDAMNETKPLPLLDQLVRALRCLPGVGPRSARRMSFHLLERDREGGRRLASVLLAAMDGIGHCRACRTLSEHELCAVCADPGRDRSVLCVVEGPADASAILEATRYRGLFFVLMGCLSPLDGIGPEDLGIDRLLERLDGGEVGEVILATGSTVEGQATAHYLAELVRAKGVRVTRIAQGVPIGGELEYVDGGTLSHALLGRQDFA
jgi:recombination protein RecR